MLGVGSELRGDDAAGGAVIAALEPKANLALFDGGTAPENFTGAIRAFAPDHLLIVDAAEIEGEPGSVRVMEEGEIAGVTFTTHMLPLTVMIDFLRKDMTFGVTVLGIRPETTGFGAEMTAPVAEAVKRVAGWIGELTVHG